MILEEQLPRVAMSSMNDTHLEEILIINQLSAAITEQHTEVVTTLLAELLKHTKDHFAGEEAMMLERGFPPYLMHKGDHDRALEHMHGIQAVWLQGYDFELLAHYVDDTLPSWITQHIQTMDTVTANFLAHGVSPCSSGGC